MNNPLKLAAQEFTTARDPLYQVAIRDSPTSHFRLVTHDIPEDTYEKQSRFQSIGDIYRYPFSTAYHMKLQLEQKGYEVALIAQGIFSAPGYHLDTMGKLETIADLPPDFS